MRGPDPDEFSFSSQANGQGHQLRPGGLALDVRQLRVDHELVEVPRGDHLLLADELKHELLLFDHQPCVIGLKLTVTSPRVEALAEVNVSIPHQFALGTPAGVKFREMWGLAVETGAAKKG